VLLLLSELSLVGGARTSVLVRGVVPAELSGVGPLAGDDEADRLLRPDDVGFEGDDAVFGPVGRARPMPWLLLVCFGSTTSSDDDATGKVAHSGACLSEMHPGIDQLPLLRTAGLDLAEPLLALAPPALKLFVLVEDRLGRRRRLRGPAGTVL